MVVEALAQIDPPAQDLPHATGAVTKEKEKKTKENAERPWKHVRKACEQVMRGCLSKKGLNCANGYIYICFFQGYFTENIR